jgi:hypothetical protein
MYNINTGIKINKLLCNMHLKQVTGKKYIAQNMPLQQNKTEAWVHVSCNALYKCFRFKNGPL